jgi:hypothetical protein
MVASSSRGGVLSKKNAISDLVKSVFENKNRLEEAFFRRTNQRFIEPVNSITKASRAEYPESPSRQLSK